jgi:hypothetical protein
MPLLETALILAAKKAIVSLVAHVGSHAAAGHAASAVASHLTTNAAVISGSKGLAIAGSHLASAGTGSAVHAVATKASIMAAKPFLTYGIAGLGATISNFLAIGIVVSGIHWGSGKVKSLESGVNCLQNNDIPGAIKHFAKLANNLDDDIENLPDLVSDYFLAVNMDEEIVDSIRSSIQNLMSEIEEEVERRNQ